MISRACYVQCDHCGDPAEIACIKGATEARAIAKLEGFGRVQGRDYCATCLPGAIQRRDVERKAKRAKRKATQ